MKFEKNMVSEQIKKKTLKDELIQINTKFRSLASKTKVKVCLLIDC